MKTQKNHSSLNYFILLLFALAFIFTACVKDDPILLASDTASVDSSIPEDPEHNNSPLPRISKSATLNEVLTEITFNPPNRRFGVAVTSKTCADRGESLIVYNPYYSNLNFYDSEKYNIHWFKDDKPIKGRHIVNCACSGKYTVVVINEGTQKGVGLARYRVERNCLSISDQTTDSSNTE